MPDITDFTPVTQETAETIRARIDANVNMGRDPSDPQWVDTVEGGIYWDLTQIWVLEAERLWDFLGTEVPAAMFPSYAWGDFLDEHALTYGIVRKDAIAATGTIRFTGTSGTLIPTGTSVGTVTTDPDGVSIVFVTTQPGSIPVGGYVDVAIQAAEVGTDSNVGAHTITLLNSPINGVASVDNAAATASGEEQESDTDLQTRVLIEIASTQGAGTISDYTKWALAYPGVGNVTVQPAWAGGGTVRVVVTDANNLPVSAGIVSGLQAILDPTSAPGAGQGLAPIGAIVTVATPNPYYVDYSATIVHSTGYTLDGTAGTIATRASIVAAVTAYVNTLAPGASVVLNRCEYAALSVPGVYDISASQLAGFLTLNGPGASNATTEASPDRAFSATNLPVPSGSVAVFVRCDLT